MATDYTTPSDLSSRTRLPAPGPGAALAAFVRMQVLHLYARVPSCPLTHIFLSPGLTLPSSLFLLPQLPWPMPPLPLETPPTVAATVPNLYLKTSRRSRNEAFLFGSYSSLYVSRCSCLLLRRWVHLSFIHPLPLRSFNIKTGTSTALPTIVADLQGDDFVWVGSSYSLAATALLPASGGVAEVSPHQDWASPIFNSRILLTQVFGRRVTMLIALAFFALGSALCGCAQNMSWLIAARSKWHSRCLPSPPKNLIYAFFEYGSYSRCGWWGHPVVDKYHCVRPCPFEGACHVQLPDRIVSVACI